VREGRRGGGVKERKECGEELVCVLLSVLTSEKGGEEGQDRVAGEDAGGGRVEVR